MVLKLGNLKGNWDGQISKVEVEKLRMAQLEHERVYEFAQIMVRFTGTQSLTLTTKDGAVVPNSDQIRKLDEYWIFERPLQNIAGSSWRLQGRGRKDNSGAAVPAPAPAAGAIAEPPK
jgi:predicted lipid-binding transport protein (Tim44 family)